MSAEKQKAERSAAIRALMEAGMSREDANLTVDLSVHVIAEAQSAMMRVCDTVPEHLRHHVVANAMIGITDNMMMGLAVLKSAGFELKELRK